MIFYFLARFILINIVLFTGLIAQTSEDFHSKLFGTRNFETFQFDPKLFVTVEYGTDKQACIISKTELNPSYDLNFRLKESPITPELQARMDFDLAFDKLLNSKKWGTLVKDFGESLGACISQSKKEYENVFERTFGNTCENVRKITYSIEFKRKQCEKVLEKSRR